MENRTAQIMQLNTDAQYRKQALEDLDALYQQQTGRPLKSKQGVLITSAVEELTGLSIPADDARLKAAREYVRFQAAGD